ncbi:MAG: carboxylating nicotinate-nucleotide diphosphorylase [Planctomycetes bacterium]|nr:carboxylating nicotinate-nucleotide diphosphorylase [Planctomycetota bacterium]
MHGPDVKGYIQLIRLAREEDLGGGDVSSEAMIPADQQGEGALVFREEGILCGMAVVGEVLSVYDDELKLEQERSDGERIQPGRRVGVVRGSMRSLLAAERVLLNFMQRLSGIATETNRYVEAIAGTGAKICDTRKTTPGWRELEKYAVRCGGGYNHRYGLYDAMLIKDNHLAALGTVDLAAGLNAAITQARERSDSLSFVEVEVDDLEQLEQVLQVAGVDIVLLDNMGTEEIRTAVALRDKICQDRGVLLEASGNIHLDRVGELARLGVDRIAVGALTHSVRSLDIGLDLVT